MSNFRSLRLHRCLTAGLAVFGLAALPATAGTACYDCEISFAESGMLTIELLESQGGLDHILELAAVQGPVTSPIFVLSSNGSLDVAGFAPVDAVGATRSMSYVGGTELVFRVTNFESPALGTPGTLAGWVFTGSSAGLSSGYSGGSFFSYVEGRGTNAITVHMEDLFPGPGPYDPGTDTFHDVSFRISLAPVPEPETYAMLLAGLGVLGAVARRRRISR